MKHCIALIVVILFTSFEYKLSELAAFILVLVVLFRIGIVDLDVFNFRVFKFEFAMLDYEWCFVFKGLNNALLYWGTRKIA